MPLPPPQGEPVLRVRVPHNNWQGGDEEEGEEGDLAPEHGDILLLQRRPKVARHVREEDGDRRLQQGQEDDPGEVFLCAGRVAPVRPRKRPEEVGEAPRVLALGVEARRVRRSSCGRSCGRGRGVGGHGAQHRGPRRWGRGQRGWRCEERGGVGRGRVGWTEVGVGEMGRLLAGARGGPMASVRRTLKINSNPIASGRAGTRRRPCCLVELFIILSLLYPVLKTVFSQIIRVFRLSVASSLDRLDDK